MPGDSASPWFKKAYPSPKIFLIFSFSQAKKKGDISAAQVLRGIPFRI